MSKFYNNNEEQQFSNLLTDLKKLPKIEAPENFEFNLMTRIQNRNFGKSEEERPKFNLLKFLAPSAAVLATVVLFFIFYPQQKEIQTQITKQQNVTDSQSIAGNTSNKNIESLFSQKSTHDVQRKDNGRVEQEVVVGSQPSKSQPIFNQRRSVSVDDYISGVNSNQNPGLKSNVVNSGDEPIVDGFLIEKKTDKKTIEKYRNEVDSLKRARIKADSLKKAGK
jgi:hypothetical protein